MAQFCYSAQLLTLLVNVLVFILSISNTFSASAFGYHGLQSRNHTATPVVIVVKIYERDSERSISMRPYRCPTLPIYPDFRRPKKLSGLRH